jgi:hypothetical protein
MKFKKVFTKRIMVAIAFLVATVSVLIAQVTTAAPKPQEQPVASPAQPPIEDSPCYFKTQEGSTLDLSRICGTSAPTESPAISRPSEPRGRDYNYRKMKEFDDSLYGRSDDVFGQQ